jgi:glycerophosphoryl diester phosphodiesterase
MLVIGHRGAAGLAPENTIEAFEAGVEAGADILEFDVRLTSDGIPVVIHDSTTLRTHKKRLTVSRMTFRELQQKTADKPIPALSEVFDKFFGSILLNIELKGKGTGTAVAELIATRYIKKQSDWDNVLFSSFKGREIAAVRKVSEKANLALLHDQNPFLFIAYERRLQLTAVGFHRLYVNRFALEIAKKLGLFIYVYTVDRPHAALILQRQGIDGIVTNHPDHILLEIDKI